MEKFRRNPEAWAAFIKTVREFFEKRGFIEVWTPQRVPAGAFESSLDPLKVTDRDGTQELHTSPEIAMKAILAEIKKPIFQICHCFRDDPDTGHHWKEFTMLEFYVPHEDFHYTQKLTRELFDTVAGRALPYSVMTMDDAFLKYVGTPIDQIPPYQKGDSWEESYFKWLIEKVEPGLPTDIPTLISHYPPSQAALAKLDKDHKWAERFEIYWQGLELCNGCTELDSVEELHRRYEKECALRQSQNKPPHSYPTLLEKAMHGMPPASGVAVGLERLFMCISA